MSGPLCPRRGAAMAIALRQTKAGSSAVQNACLPASWPPKAKANQSENFPALSTGI